ncbi:uncharacterized protein [Narcine bancroftii]|uniref:uncharacterized protein n=1 Tax=Narcine bancroftii TaxID=1343680 RepID=UPI00383126DC
MFAHMVQTLGLQQSEPNHRSAWWPFHPPPKTEYEILRDVCHDLMSFLWTINLSIASVSTVAAACLFSVIALYAIRVRRKRPMAPPSPDLSIGKSVCHKCGLCQGKKSKKTQSHWKLNELTNTNEEGEEMENRCAPLHKSQEAFYCTKKLHDATQTSNELILEAAKDDLNEKKAITETSFEVTFEDYLGCDCCEKKVTYEKLSDEKFRSTSSHTSQDNTFERSWRLSIASEQSFSRQYSLSKYTLVGTNTSQQFSSDEIWGSSSVSQTAPDEMCFVIKSLDKNTASSGRGSTRKPTRYVSHNSEKYSVPTSYFKTNETIQLSDSEIAFSTELPPGDIYNLEEECAKVKNINSSSDQLVQKCALLTQENLKTFDELQCRKMFQNFMPMVAKKFKTAKKYLFKTDKDVVYQPTPCFPMLHESQMMKLGLNVAKKASNIQWIMSPPLPSEMLERNEVALPINTPLQSKLPSKPKIQSIGLPKPEYVGKGDLPAEHQQAEWKDLIKQMAYSSNSEISLQKIPFLKPIVPGKGFKRLRSSYIPFIDQVVATSLELNLKHKYITHLWGTTTPFQESVALMIPIPPPVSPSIKTNGVKIENIPMEISFIDSEIKKRPDFHILQKKFEHICRHVRSRKLIASQLKPCFGVHVPHEKLSFITIEQQLLNQNVKERGINCKECLLPKAVQYSIQHFIPDALQMKDDSQSNPTPMYTMPRSVGKSINAKEDHEVYTPCSINSFASPAPSRKKNMQLPRIGERPTLCNIDIIEAADHKSRTNVSCRDFGESSNVNCMQQPSACPKEGAKGKKDLNVEKHVQAAGIHHVFHHPGQCGLCQGKKSKKTQSHWKLNELTDTNEEGKEMENGCVPLHKGQEGFYCTNVANRKLLDSTQTSNELTLEAGKDDLNENKAIKETSFQVTFEDYLGCDCCEKTVTSEKLSDEKSRSTSSHTSQDNTFESSWSLSIAFEHSFSRQYSLSKYTLVGTNTSQQFSSDEIWGSSSVSQTGPDEMCFVNNKSLDKNTDSSGRGSTWKPTRYGSHNSEKYSVPSSYFKRNETIQLSDSEIAFSTELPPGDIYNLEEECAKVKNTNSCSDPLIQKCALLTQENLKTFDELQCIKMLQNVMPMAAKKFKTGKKYQVKTDKDVVYQPTPCCPMLHESQMMKLGLNVAKKASIIQWIMSLPLPSEMLERNEVALPINTPLQSKLPSKPKKQCIGLPKPEYVGKGDLPAEHQQAEWKDRLEFGLIKQMAYSSNSEISLQKIPFRKPIAPGKGFKRPRTSYIHFIDQEVVASLELNLKHKYITHLWGTTTPFQESVALMIPIAPPVSPAIKTNGVKIENIPMEISFSDSEIKKRPEFHILQKKFEHICRDVRSRKLIASQLKPYFGVHVPHEKLSFITIEQQLLNQNVKERGINCKECLLPKAVQYSIQHFIPDAPQMKDDSQSNPTPMYTMPRSVGKSINAKEDHEVYTPCSINSFASPAPSRKKNMQLPRIGERPTLCNIDIIEAADHKSRTNVSCRNFGESSNVNCMQQPTACPKEGAKGKKDLNVEKHVHAAGIHHVSHHPGQCGLCQVKKSKKIQSHWKLNELTNTNEEGEEMENRCAPLHKSQEGFYCTKKHLNATQTPNELKFEEAKDDLNENKAIKETSFQVTFEDYLGCDCCEKTVTSEKISDEKSRSTSFHTSQDNTFESSWTLSIASEQSFSRQDSLSRYTSVGTNTSQQFSSDEIWGTSSVSQTAPDEMCFVNNKSLDRNTDSSGRGSTRKPTRYGRHNSEKYSLPSS